ncbi:MAG TPA: ATP-binding cassette domain-containing protein [Steroidobacteraceae bacterium]|nr:ATP-binding cassette domain-containing protein [Steroidobacteraceae bacterium]
MIEACALSKSFGAGPAVREVSFTAQDGRITGLLGPNGAGKSTTLRMLYTVLRPDGGDALIDGLSVRVTPLDAARRLGVLTHNPGVYPNLSARENILYFAALQGLSAREARERTAALLQLLEMEEFAERRARGLSQGERLKTALARALVHRPRNLILDEPTNGLDVMAVRTLRRLLRALRAEGHCVLFSSHVMPEVSALCDEVVVLGGGVVRACGTPEEIGSGGAHALEEAFVQLLTGEAQG